MLAITKFTTPRNKESGCRLNDNGDIKNLMYAVIMKMCKQDLTGLTLQDTDAMS